jgi:hypothetical protein
VADPARLEAVLAIVRRTPGLTAYQVSVLLPPGPVPPHRVLDPLVADPPSCATTGEALQLLEALSREGLARRVPDPRGARWYRGNNRPPDGV